MANYRRKAGERAKPFKSDLDGSFDGGRAEIETLKDEMESWAESLEGANMESVPKYDEVTEAKDALEAGLDRLDSIDVPDFLREEDAEYTQDTRRSAESRSGRLSNALSQLQAALDAAQAWIDENPELPADGDVTQQAMDDRKAEIEAAETFIGELEDAIGEVDQVSFPGMY